MFSALTCCSVCAVRKAQSLCTRVPATMPETAGYSNPKNSGEICHPGTPEPHTRNPITLNPKPQTPNPKPQTLGLKPPDPKLRARTGGLKCAGDGPRRMQRGFSKGFLNPKP